MSRTQPRFPRAEKRTAGAHGGPAAAAGGATERRVVTRWAAGAVRTALRSLEAATAARRGGSPGGPQDSSPSASSSAAAHERAGAASSPSPAPTSPAESRRRGASAEPTSSFGVVGASSRPLSAQRRCMPPAHVVPSRSCRGAAPVAPPAGAAAGGAGGGGNAREAKNASGRRRRLHNRSPHGCGLWSAASEPSCGGGGAEAAPATRPQKSEAAAPLPPRPGPAATAAESAPQSAARKPTGPSRAHRLTAASVLHTAAPPAAETASSSRPSGESAADTQPGSASSRAAPPSLSPVGKTASTLRSRLAALPAARAPPSRTVSAEARRLLRTARRGRCGGCCGALLVNKWPEEGRGSATTSAHDHAAAAGSCVCDGSSAPAHAQETATLHQSSAAAARGGCCCCAPQLPGSSERSPRAPVDQPPNMARPAPQKCRSTRRTSCCSGVGGEKEKN